MAQNYIKIYQLSLENNYMGTLYTIKNMVIQLLKQSKCKPQDILIQEFLYDLVAGINYQIDPFNMQHLDYKPHD